MPTVYGYKCGKAEVYIILLYTKLSGEDECWKNGHTFNMTKQRLVLNYVDAHVSCHCFAMLRSAVLITCVSDIPYTTAAHHHITKTDDGYTHKVR